MKYFNYKIARDFGFAPNPFGGLCTLATCKPGIRNAAREGDWIVGTGSKALNCNHQLIYAMQVSDIISYNDYWHMSEYAFKKPVPNGSLVKMYGDNIYHQDESNEWRQANSHHSLPNGKVNELNLMRDTGSTNVLLSTNFYYFGSAHFALKGNFSFIERQGWKYLLNEEGDEIIHFLQTTYKVGFY